MGPGKLVAPATFDMLMLMLRIGSLATRNGMALSGRVWHRDKSKPIGGLQMVHRKHRYAVQTAPIRQYGSVKQRRPFMAVCSP